MKKIDLSFIVAYLSPINDKLKKSDKREFIVSLEAIVLIDFVPENIRNIGTLQELTTLMLWRDKKEARTI